MDPALCVFRFEGNTVALYLDRGAEGTVSVYSATSMSTVALPCGDVDKSIMGCAFAAQRGEGVTLIVGSEGCPKARVDFDLDDVPALYAALVECRGRACAAGKIPPLARPHEPTIEPQKAPTRTAKPRRARRAA